VRIDEHVGCRLGRNRLPEHLHLNPRPGGELGRQVLEDVTLEN